MNPFVRLRLKCRAIVFGLTFIAACFQCDGQSFTNNSAIVINDSENPPTVASPYPSQVFVSGIASPVSKVTVEIDGFGHGWPDDVAVELVSPAGQSALLFSNIGGAAPGATNITLVLDDDAPTNLPFRGPLISGTFKPTERYPITFSFPPPAVGTPGPPALSTFRGVDANGAWSLYVVDTATLQSGIITSGWSLTIVPQPVLHISQVGGDVQLSWPLSAADYTLQASPGLNNPVAWTNAMAILSTNGNSITASVPLISTSDFFRLKK
jgi:subtilisin-like proprotein convertase family protein